MTKGIFGNILYLIGFSVWIRFSKMGGQKLTMADIRKKLCTVYKKNMRELSQLLRRFTVVYLQEWISWILFFSINESCCHHFLEVETIRIVSECNIGQEETLFIILIILLLLFSSYRDIGVTKLWKDKPELRWRRLHFSRMSKLRIRVEI